MVFSEINTFIREKIMAIKNLHAFDFDDTLAITSSKIGVQRKNESGKTDEFFLDWIVDNNLDFESIDNEGQPGEIIWFSSEDYAKYQKALKDDSDYLESNGIIDSYDFSKTSSIDVDSAEPISPMVELLKSVQSQPDSLAIILTARMGKGSIESLDGLSVPATNIEDIYSFLDNQGATIGKGNINTAGDIGDGPSAKATIMKSYIDRYKPENVYFYDDSTGNVDAIAGLCQDYYPHVKIKVYTVGHGGSLSDPAGCYENYFHKFSNLFS